MRELITAYLPWLISVITITQIVMAGNKHRHAWAVGLGNQAFWLTWIIASASWGLLPMNAVIWIVYVRNHMKWRSA